MEEKNVKECIGCGYCCIAIQCPISSLIYGYVQTCPALEWNGLRHVCKLMKLPGDLGDFFRLQIGSGTGCTEPGNPWRKEVLRSRLTI